MNEVIVLKRQQLKISKLIDVLNPEGPGALRAWKEWFEIDKKLKELEEAK